jgi:hypothetical protein
MHAPECYPRPLTIYFSEALSCLPPEQAATIIRAQLLVLYLADLLYLQKHPETPKLIKSGVRYQRQPFSVEDWLDVGQVLARRFADCKSLGTWLAAELTTAGEPARPSLTWKRGERGVQFHVTTRIVRTGQILDPSKALGM